MWTLWMGCWLQCIPFTRNIYKLIQPVYIRRSSPVRWTSHVKGLKCLYWRLQPDLPASITGIFVYVLCNCQSHARNNLWISLFWFEMKVCFSSSKYGRTFWNERWKNNPVITQIWLRFQANPSVMKFFHRRQTRLDLIYENFSDPLAGISANENRPLPRSRKSGPPRLSPSNRAGSPHINRPLAGWPKLTYAHVGMSLTVFRANI